MSGEKKDDRRRSERESSEITAELYLESSLFKAQTVDVSDHGVRMQLNKPIRFQIRFRMGERLVSRHAEMVWSQEVEQDKAPVYGFKYVD
jgi:hypothetical protein